MPFCFDILPEKRAIFVRFEGRFTLEQLLAAARELWADPRYSPAYDGLVDISAGSISIDMKDLRKLIAFLLDEPATSRGRWAAVATTPLAIAGGLLYRSAMKSRHVFDVFSTWEAACEFVMFDPALFPPRKAPAGGN